MQLLIQELYICPNNTVFLFGSHHWNFLMGSEASSALDYTPSCLEGEVGWVWRVCPVENMLNVKYFFHYFFLFSLPPPFLSWLP